MIRVSKEREEMVAPELQRTAIDDHCGRRGYVVTRWIEGIDESGSQRRSKWWAKLDQAVELVEAGEADVIVVWRFSRTARQRRRWAVAIDRVEVAGGLLESATEPLDTSTASGRLARGMLAEMAAYEAEVIGATWREVHARRVRQGLPANGKPRWGYRYVDGLHRPDPETGPVLAELYRRYVAGESVYALVAWLNQQGYRTAPGYSRIGPGPWTQMTLRRVLDSGFAAGLIATRAGPQRGVHEPVIDDAVWTAYRAARAARRTRRRAERSQYLLSGLVRCWHPLENGLPCRSPMGGGQFGHRHEPKYRCLAMAARRLHSGGYVTMHLVEAEVLDWLRGVADELNQAADAAAAEQARAARRRHDAAQLTREVVELDKALVRLEVNRAAAPDAMPTAVYEAARDELLERRNAVEQRRLTAEAESREGRPVRTAARLLAEWGELPVDERRGMLRELIARIQVTPGRPRSAVEIVPVWAE